MSIQLLTPKGQHPLPRTDGFPHTLSVDVQDLDLDQINTEIQLLGTRLHDLKARHNQLTFTACVPDDILLLVFSRAQQEGSSGKKPYAWMTTLGTVCQRWRRLLIGTPSLWTYLDPSVTGSAFVDLLLARSRGCLLDISLRGRDKYLLPESTRQLLHRARTLSMLGDPVDADRHLDAPAPSLEELDVDLARRYYAFCSTEAETELVKPFFGGVAPRLRRVRFVAYSTPARSWVGLLANVQYLELNLSSWEGLVPAVAEMKAVRELVLSFPSHLHDTTGDWAHGGGGEGEGGAAAGFVVSAATPRHHLPTLSVLHLCSITSACSAFLAHFAIPQNAQLIFTIALEMSPARGDSEELARSVFECRSRASDGQNDIQAMMVCTHGHLVAVSPMPVFKIRLWNNLLAERREADSPLVLVSVGNRRYHFDIWLAGWLRCAYLWTIKEVEVEGEGRSGKSGSMILLCEALEPFKCATVVKL